MMGNFNRDNRSGDRRNFSRREFGRRGSDGRAMHKTTCSRCGNECEVPFIPSGDRPVFCSKCFENNGSSDSRRFGGRKSGRSNFGDKRMYEAVCDTCGKNCTVPFQPTEGKPIYCSRCFENKSDKRSRDANQYKEQFEVLNTKLDKILKLLLPAVSNEVAQEEKTMEKIDDPKPKKQANKTEVKKTVAKKTTAAEKKEDKKETPPVTS